MKTNTSIYHKFRFLRICIKILKWRDIYGISGIRNLSGDCINGESFIELKIKNNGLWIKWQLVGIMILTFNIFTFPQD